jgi:DnaJ-class molecular chaperone
MSGFNYDNGDYYFILGLSQNSTKKEIRQAYLKLATIYHPDKFIKEKEKINAHDKFIKIGKAYEILYDDNKRYLYDLNYEDIIKNKEKNSEKEEFCFNFDSNINNNGVKLNFFIDKNNNLFKYYNDLFKQHSKIFNVDSQDFNNNKKTKSFSLIKSDIKTTKSSNFKNGFVYEKTETFCENGAVIETIRKYNPNRNLIKNKK